MIRLSIPLRLALSRLSLPVLVALAFGAMLVGKADTSLVERARMTLADTLSPIYAVMAQPLNAVRDAAQEARMLWAMREENARLREENERLHRWQAAALSLEAENDLLRRQLNVMPEAPWNLRTARVVADAGGTYARAVLLALAPGVEIRKGQVALDERGLAGRVTEVGDRSARVLLVTDMNSRIPVTLEGSRARAIMAGTNGNRPRLQHWPEGAKPQEGERVVTSAEASVFPAGLPVGVVRWTEGGTAEVELFARLESLDILRIFDFGLSGILPPESVARPEPRGRR
ncbi:rod shape-determining protein MreC [Roseomonas marmotae]|uniref:Cell shape-determining protein MreC n=1 Tax=Roseomonas marmotae TaxID=2768161 RepID=A0ABS3KFL6_9PROT|nr:rod shape-determining protein MreC [Roseomonas marmotae]MBO1076234.1 rod shape-determining protein MreC [Roseomonas marmotae]QTI77882.1 rod shape-determining protein MreC [Roseomonas marmotae]